MKIVRSLPPQIPPNKYVALDVEIFGMNDKQLHRPTSGKFACLSICSETEPDTVYMVEHELDVPAVFRLVQDAVHVYHNAKFDITQLRRWANIDPRNKMLDTMLFERILWNGYYDGFALNDLARRYLDMKLDKEVRNLFSTATEMTDELVEYAAKDAWITLQVLQKQLEIAQGIHKRTGQEIERDAVWAVMDFQGFRLDVDAWEDLAKKNKARAKELDANMPINPKSRINPNKPMNPRSPVQVKDLLRLKGFKGLPSTGVEVLEKFIHKYPKTEAAKIAQDVLLSRKYSTRASRYGMTFIRDFIEDDLVAGWSEEEVKVVFGDYNSIGAETFRMACSSPNMQNIIARDTSEFRECFIARPGNVILVADYSQQEPCIFAYLTQDKKLIEIVNTGKDIYIEVAWEMLGERITKEDKRRAPVKSVVLGTQYGLTEYGLADRENITKAEAGVLIDKFLKTFPEAAIWMDQQRKKKNYVKTVLGTKIYLNPYSKQCENNALNSPIQGSAGQMTKKALSEIYKNWRWDYDFPVVAVVHDELVLDVPKKIAEEVSEFVKDTMVRVAEDMCPGIKFRAHADVGSSWAAKS